MDSIIEFVRDHFPFLINQIYPVLFFGSLFEGMNTHILGGFLASFGKVRLSFILPIFILGHTLNGFMWYSVGRLGGAKALDRWGYKHKVSRDMISKISNFFERHSGKAIVLSKFTFSLEIATLVFAGSIRYNLNKFVRYNFIGSVGWVAITVFIGYFFGQSYQWFFTVVKSAGLFILFFGLSVALIYILGYKFKGFYERYVDRDQRVHLWSQKIQHQIERLFGNGDK